MNRRLLAALFALVALAAPASTPARPIQDSQLQIRLARALQVPHVAPARSAAVAVDLTTGTVLFQQNSNRPLAPASGWDAHRLAWSPDGTKIAYTAEGDDDGGSEERRVGKECRLLCRSRWSPYH